jgi:hypothetical protein
LSEYDGKHQLWRIIGAFTWSSPGFRGDLVSLENILGVFAYPPKKNISEI